VSRLKTYCLFTIALVVPAIFFVSCSSTKKATVTTKTDVLPVHKQLSYDQQNELTATFFDANKEKIMGNYDKALALFFQVLKIDPANADANFEVGGILEYYKQPDSALVYARRAAELDPSNTWYREMYAQCLDDKGFYKDMINVYQGLIKIYPGNTDYYYKIAMGQIEDGQYENAATTYDTIEKQEGGFSEEITRERLKIYEKTKNYSKAEQQVNWLLKHDSTNARYYDMLGDLYEIEGKDDKAFSLYQQMETKYPDDASIHLSLAHYYREKHEDKKAGDELEAAFKQPSMDIDSKIRILLSFYQASNGHDSLQMQSITLCAAMVQAHPTNPKAHSMYGDFLVRQGSYKEARDQYRITISEDSSKYSIWNQLMSTDIQLNDPSDLIKVTSSAMELFPEHPEPYLFNGFANSQEKKYDAAVSSLNKGIDYVVNDNVLLTQFYATLGDIYNSIKKYSASDSAYEEALKIDPANDNVLNNYSYYLSVRDTEMDKADQMAKKANEISVNNYTYEDTYAWVLYREGKYNDAKEWEEKSLGNGGQKDATVLDHYGDILFKAGDKDRAVQYWQKAKDGGLKSDVIDKKISDKQLYEK